MFYRLQNDLWFCLAGKHLVFLDVRGDRYFQLPAAQERAFISYMQGGSASDVASLLGQQLASDWSLMTLRQPRAIRSPERSALEQASIAFDIRLAMLLEVSVTIALVLLRLKTRPLKNVLASMCRFRERRAVEPHPCDKQATHLLNAARTFNGARLYIPVAPSCLLDSLSLTVFLARRHFHSTVVFGVTCAPFSAHSWVQVGDMVLNDTVGNANSYTPIGMF